MRHVRLIQATILLVLFAACPMPATSGPDLTQQLDALFDDLPHATFEWAKAKGVSDRAAINIPVSLDGTEGWFQLDTGLDVTWIYGNIPDERGWDTHDGMYHVPSFEIGGIDLGPTWLRSNREAGKRGELIGSLGLDLMVGYWVLIDYPGRRFALMRPGEAPLWFWQSTTWTPAALRDAKFFPYVILGGRGMDGFLFDTGSSAYDIIVDFDDWAKLTGRDGPDAASTKQAGNSWEKSVTIFGAPARGPLVIGSAHIANPQVYYLKEKPKVFSEWPFPAKGLIGNSPFFDRVVVMDLGIRPRFGLLQ
jgi:hypothetical protein